MPEAIHAGAIIGAIAIARGADFPKVRVASAALFDEINTRWPYPSA